jgi:hypothetical protein
MVATKEARRCAVVVAQNVLLFLADGRELKSDVLEEAWDRGGEGGTSSVSHTTLASLMPARLWGTVGPLFSSLPSAKNNSTFCATTPLSLDTSS